MVLKDRTFFRGEYWLDLITPDFKAKRGYLRCTTGYKSTMCFDPTSCPLERGKTLDVNRAGVGLNLWKPLQKDLGSHFKQIKPSKRDEIPFDKRFVHLMPLPSTQGPSTSREKKLLMQWE